MSRALELEQWRNPVPKNTKAIDVVVIEPTKAAIEQMIAALDRLSGYTIVAYWIPSNCSEI